MVRQWSRWVVVSVILCVSPGGYSAQANDDDGYAKELQEFVAKLVDVVIVQMGLDLDRPIKDSVDYENTLALLKPNTKISQQCESYRPYQTLSEAFEQDLIYLERLDEPYGSLINENVSALSIGRDQQPAHSQDINIHQEFIPTLKLAINIKDNALSLTFYPKEGSSLIIKENFLFDKDFHQNRFSQFDYIKLTQRQDIPDDIKNKCHFYNLSDDSSVVELKKLVQTIDAELTIVLDYFFKFEKDPKLFVDALKASQQSAITINKRTAQIHPSS